MLKRTNMLAPAVLGAVGLEVCRAAVPVQLMGDLGNHGRQSLTAAAKVEPAGVLRWVEVSDLGRF